MYHYARKKASGTLYGPESLSLVYAVVVKLNIALLMRHLARGGKLELTGASRRHPGDVALASLGVEDLPPFLRLQPAEVPVDSKNPSLACES